jgi:hypothetical protein
LIWPGDEAVEGDRHVAGGVGHFSSKVIVMCKRPRAGGTSQ